MSLKVRAFSETYNGISPVFRVVNNRYSFNKPSLRYPHHIITPSLDTVHHSSTSTSKNVIVCGLKGPRPRYPRVWKSQKRIGTISKSKRLVDCIKGLSNVKEEVYGALDAFIAWELEFPLITVKKALKTLEDEKEWKRVIQVAKWMLSKGQGRTMGSYYTLLNALAEEDRLEEAEELWTKLFSENLESMPRYFFDEMISIYYDRGMHDKLFDTFADMEELGIRPTTSIVSKVGDVFQKLGMMDKYEKLNRKYPPPKWEYRYFNGKRVKVKAKQPDESLNEDEDLNISDGEGLETNDTNSSATTFGMESDQEQNGLQSCYNSYHELDPKIRNDICNEV